MTFSNAKIRITSHVLLVAFASITCYVPATQAAMIGTEQLLLSAEQRPADRVHLEALLNRSDLAEQLEAAGVDRQQLLARVNALTDDEVAAINNQLDNVPAGGDIISTAVFIFLVLLVTDILGYTDIFPFVKKTVK